MLNKLLNRFYPDKKITHLWQNVRIRALIKLPLWFIFMLLLYLVFTITTPEKGPSFKQMQDELLNYNFDYKIEVNDNNQNILYKGSCNKDCVIYKEKDLQVFEYYEKDNEIYEVISGKLSPASITKNKYLDLNYIFSLTKDIKPKKKTDSFIFNMENIIIEMKFNNKSFTEFIISDNNVIYKYKFVNIGKVSEINY